VCHSLSCFILILREYEWLMTMCENVNEWTCNVVYTLIN
jgi:hypothetical protein